MPRAPATRDQADAYRFGLRRLEAALVRGDPVPLHEQIRTQRRAAFAGVLLGLLGLCAAAAYAVVVPRPDWRHEEVVTGTPSGALYVVAHEPDRLVPVADLPAARLVLAALGGARPAEVSATAVPDDAIAAAPRTPTAAVPGAVAVTPEVTVAARWAVCDTVGADGALQSTTVVGGAVPVAATGGGDGVLLAGPDDAEWLVTGGLRHRVDAGDGALRAAFRLTDRLPRAADPALLSLVPEGAPLATPVIAGRGDPAPSGLPGAVGDVLVRDGGDAPQYFAVLAGGLQEVPRPAADLLAATSAARVPRPVGPDVIGNAPTADDLRFDGWPDGPVRLAEPADAPVTCWMWSPERGDVVTGPALPVPAGTAPVLLAGGDGPGAGVDAVAVGAGGAVRATGPGRAPGAGPVWLVSATGVAYGVADGDTAAALGVGVVEPAPEAVLKLLPTGPPLALDGARHAVDVLPGG